MAELTSIRDTTLFLSHDKLAYGYRVILVLEFWCIPSIALLACGGMAMVKLMVVAGIHKTTKRKPHGV